MGLRGDSQGDTLESHGWKPWEEVKHSGPLP